MDEMQPGAGIDPILRLVEESRAALAANLYSVGLMSTLATIDICAALASADGRTSRKKFEAWFTEHFKAKYFDFDASDAYQLRCGTLHQGQTVAKNYRAIIFTLPNEQQNYLHNNVLNEVLNLDLETFCNDVLGTVELWWHTNRADPLIAANAVHLARVRPEGLKPYIVGLPLFG